MIKKNILIAFIVLLISSALGEKVYGQTNNDEISFQWFWFLYEHEITSDYNVRVFRPFFMRHRIEEGFYDASLIPVLF